MALFSQGTTEEVSPRTGLHPNQRDLGMLVGAAIAGYDYVVNELLWSSLSRHLAAASARDMHLMASEVLKDD
jgi:hypothetical protein